MPTPVPIRPPIPSRPKRPFDDASVDAVVPARNEARSIAAVVQALLARGVRRVVVVDNGSTDGTASVAARAGARVVPEPVAGYGRACRRGIEALVSDPPEIVVFADGDGADVPEDLPALVAPIVHEDVNLVVGSRLRGADASAALPLHVRVGNRFAAFLLRSLFGVPFTDLGPFRAIDYESLKGLGMRDEAFGWTVEMQARAALTGLKIAEVPVRYRERTGRSKISGTVVGSSRAAWGILTTIARIGLLGRRHRGSPRGEA